MKMFSFTKEVTSKEIIFLATLYFTFVLNSSFWRYIFQNMELNSFCMFWFAFSLVFFISLPLFIGFNLLILPKIGKYILSFLLLLATGTNFMMFHYGIFIDKNMIQNVMETNYHEAFDLITPSLCLNLIVFAGLPLLFLIKVKIKFSPFKIELKSRLIKVGIALLIAAIFAGTSFKEYASFFRNHREVKGVTNIINVVAGCIGYGKKLHNQNIPLKVLDEHPQLKSNKPQILVFILGETARTPNFSLAGYSKKTNPLLSQQNITFFPHVTSCATATAASVPCLFSHLTHDTFDVVQANHTQNLVDILKQAGYHIVWVDNDSGCKGVCENANEKIDISVENYPDYCQSGTCYDETLIQELQKRLPQVTQNTVFFLHMIGSHGPSYFQRYPKKFKVFQPTCETSDIQDCSQMEIANTYDNTILYTDYIVNQAIDLLKHSSLPGSLIYLSDHGESLGERNIYLHGLPFSIAPEEQKQVPLVFWTNTKDINLKCLNFNANKHYSHDNIFHSVLGLMNVSTTAYQPELDIFHACQNAF